MVDRIPIVRAIIYNDGEILVLQNTDDDGNPEARGKWEHVGGRIEKHDDHERAALRREVKEETGLDVTIEEKLPRIAVEEDGKVADCQLYLAHTESRNVELSDEHQDYRWIDPAAFKDMDWLNYAGYTIPLLREIKENIV